MNEAILVALISGVCSLCGTFYGIRKSNSLTEYKLEELRREVEKHNSLVDRTYKAEGRLDVVETRMKVQEHRMEDIEELTKTK